MGDDPTPDEVQQAVSSDLPPELRQAFLLGDQSLPYSDGERMLLFMVRKGLITEEVYAKLIDHEFSHRRTLPARQSPSWAARVMESKNPVPSIAALSRTVGALKKGNTVIRVRREEKPELDPRDVMELFQEKLVQKQVTLQNGLLMLEQFGSVEPPAADVKGRALYDAWRLVKQHLELPNTEDQLAKMLAVSSPGLTEGLRTLERLAAVHGENGTVDESDAKDFVAAYRTLARALKSNKIVE